VLTDPRLMETIHGAFSDMDAALDPVAMVELAVRLADHLLANDKSANRPNGSSIDFQAASRAKEYIDANLDQIVSSEQLELVTGLDRYVLARQFGKAFGTSPYRYLTMRRLDHVRASIAAGANLVEVAVKYGFSDQSHMTRRFKSTYGISPGRWQRLVRRVQGLVYQNPAS
jgi:AraC-like DNA-binding protein